MARLGTWSGHGPQLDLHQPTFDLDERALGVEHRIERREPQNDAAHREDAQRGQSGDPKERDLRLVVVTVIRVIVVSVWRRL